MRFGLLGSLEALDDQGRPVDVGGAQPRTVLAMLLVARGQVVSVDALIDAIWGERPPPSAGGTLQSYVSRLRRAIEPARPAGTAPTVLVSDPPGYRLHVAAAEVDFRRFDELADEGRARLDAGDPAGARELLGDALALWRGPALVEFADHDFARGTAARLEERRLVAVEHRLEADLRLGRHATVIGELAEQVRAHPLREGLRGLLALALYRAGRQAEALRAIDDTRRTLRDELGIDPSRAIRDLEARIFAHDPALDLPEPPTPPAPPPAAPPPVPAAPPPPAGGAGAPTFAPPTFAAGAPLVGRAAELAQLVASLEEACGGRTRWALVEGEPGIGKTRLLEELAAEAAARGAQVVWGRCYEGGGAPSFWPWLGVLRALVDSLGPEDRDRAASGGVGQLLGAAPAAPARLNPGVDPSRFQLFEAVAGVLTAVAARRPVALFFDDLQWADQASHELWEFLAQRLRESPILMVGSIRELEIGRNDELVAAVAAVGRQAGVRRVRLGGLAPAGTAALIEQATGAPPSPEAVAAIHGRAEGNPFYVGELARLWAEGSDLGGVPAGVRDVVRRRLSRLPAATTELLQVAAVIGRDFDVALLTRASGLSVDRCLDDLEPALVQRLLLPAPDQPATFRFAHALVREVVVDDVSPLRRARFHQRVADAILGAAGDSDDTAEIVAEHLWAAVPLGLEHRAAHALERGADVAIRRFAYEAADDLLERAVQLRKAAGATPEELEAELLAISRLAAVRRTRRGYRAGAKAVPMDRAKELAERTGRLDVLAALLWFEWAGAATSCDFAVAEPLAADLLELAQVAGDPVARAIGYHSWGVQCWHRGRMVEAARHLDESLASGAEPGMAALLESGPLVRAFHLHVHELLGDVDDGAARFRELAARQPDPISRLIVHAMDAMTAAVAGDAARAARAGRAALADDPHEAVEFFGGGSQLYTGWAVAELGDPDAGLRLMARGKERFLATGGRTILPLYTSHAALAWLRAGRVDQAEAAIAEAHGAIEAYGERWFLPIVLLCEAQVRRAAGSSGDDVLALVDEARALAAASDIALLVRRADAVALAVGASLR